MTVTQIKKELLVFGVLAFCLFESESLFSVCVVLGVKQEPGI